MKRFAAASLVVLTAASCAAQGEAPPYYSDWQDVYVKDADSCPMGFIPIVRSYERQNGRWVQTGYLCQSLYRDRRPR